MPLTDFQAEVLRVIAGNRSIGSHVAGGVALNAAPGSARFSEDIDLFHDAGEAVATASEQDCATLAGAGYAVDRQLWEPTYRRAWVARGGQGLKIEWAQDAAWRFFPVESDPLLGWRLHPFDALTNKALAMGARSETRDLVDLVSYSDRFRLAAVVWAACAKDPGWTPVSLLEQMRRNARIDRAALDEMSASIEPTKLKQSWLRLAEEAETDILTAAKLGLEIGLAFLDHQGAVAWHDTAGAQPHRATLGGVVPRLTGLRYDLPNS
jgi:hypothetical protein